MAKYHCEIGLFIARVFLGLLFVFQGADAVFKIKLRNVTQAVHANFSGSHIPSFVLSSAAWFTSITELVCGALLVLGLFEYIALYLLGLNLLLAAAGFGLKNPLWDTRNVFPRLSLLILLLFTPQQWNIFSIDYLLFNI